MSDDKIFQILPHPQDRTAQLVSILKNSVTRTDPLNPSFLSTAESINSSSFTVSSLNVSVNAENSEFPPCLKMFVEKKYCGFSPLTWVSLVIVLLIVLVIFGASMIESDLESLEDRKHPTY